MLSVPLSLSACQVVPPAAMEVPKIVAKGAEDNMLSETLEAAEAAETGGDEGREMLDH